ncbi:MAG: hypothetical protein AB8F34_02275 [Akkermansiaceae bacterium]
MNQPTKSTIISANGKCLSQPPEDLDELEILIDGKQMANGCHETSLLGGEGDHLPESIQYRLIAFEPQQDGTCVARYVRVNADEKRSAND